MSDNILKDQFSEVKIFDNGIGIKFKDSSGRNQYIYLKTEDIDKIVDVINHRLFEKMVVEVSDENNIDNSISNNEDEIEEAVY